jgi:segregation and condensation protein B
MKIESIIEALLFATPKAMSAEDLIKVLEQTKYRVGSELECIIPSLDEIESIIKKLQETYDREGRAFQIYEVNHGYKLGTRAVYAPWVETLYQEKPMKLSAAALETLAVIAYRQPISRAEIEAIRGVAVDGVIQSLMERKLIKNAGRSALPGRPVLYQTTDFFLEQFGLSSLDELPDVHELKRIDIGVHGSNLFNGRDSGELDSVDQRASVQGNQVPTPEIETRASVGLNEET